MENVSDYQKMKKTLIQKEKKIMDKLKMEQWQEALELLQQAENILEFLAQHPQNKTLVQEEKIENSNLILSVLYNSALCFQRLQNYEEVVVYLDACAYNLKCNNISSDEGKTTSQKLSNKIKKYKLQCKISIQLCAFLSQANKHEEALYHAKNGLFYARKFIQETLVILQEHERIHQKLQKNTTAKNRQILESVGYQQICQLVEKSSPIINSIKDRLNGDRFKKAIQINLRSSLGVQHQKE